MCNHPTLNLELTTPTEGWYRCADCREKFSTRLEPFRITVERGKRECEIPPPGWRCTRTPGHDGPCAAVEDEHVAWLRYSRSSSALWPTRILVCDSDAPGAFKVYRAKGDQ